MKEAIRKGPNERHKDVKAVARKLFEERGYENVTTKEIAEAAGLSRALIYRYNISKADLLAELLRDMIAEQAASLRRIKLNESTAEEMIVDYFERLFSLDMKQVALRRLAVHHSWSWDAATEEDFYLRMGAIFDPLEEPLRVLWGIDLHEPARIALWAIYTEALRASLARKSGEGTTEIENWKSAFAPAAGLVVNGLVTPKPNHQTRET